MDYQLLRGKIPAVPASIEGLASLALNLSWSWHREARALFAAADHGVWHRTRHNPVWFLNEIDPARLDQLDPDPLFIAELDRVTAWMAGERRADLTWLSAVERPGRLDTRTGNPTAGGKKTAGHQS